MAGGGLALGIERAVRARPQNGAANEVNVWVAIKPDDTCVIRIARSEMGQGTLTGLAQLVAEELECDWSKVTTEGITPGRNLASKRAWGEMGTGGSRGIRTSQDYVRRGGAAARMMLLQAAADQWKVPVAELTVSKGVISHAASKRKTSYGKVAAAASKVTPPDPKAIKLKDPKDWTIAGKPLKRLDTADKLNGSKIYAIDLKLPGMLCAAIKDCPVFGGKLKSYDESKIAGMPGVKKVVKVKDTGVAVVADTWWRAKKALDALPIVWDEAGNGDVSSASIAEQLKEGLDRGHDQRRSQERRCAESHRRGAEEGRGGLFDAVPRARLHGDDERHREALGRQGRVLGAVAEPRSVARGAVGGLRHSARQLRDPPPRPRRRLRPARRHAGLRASGGGDRQGIPRHPGQADLEPRGRPGARLLPPDLAVQAVGRPRCRRQAHRPACPRVRAVDQRHAQPGSASSAARTCASSRATTPSPATRSSATACRTC